MTGKAKLRWHQFRLSTLLLITALVAGGLVGWRVFVVPYRQQWAAIKTIQRLGGTYEAVGDWQTRLFGQGFLKVTLVNLADCDEPDEYLEDLAHLPFLEVLVVGGPKFSDEHLHSLVARRALRGVVLDSTSVSAAGLAGWRARCNDVDLYESDRRPLAAMDGIRNFGMGFTTAPADGHDDLVRRLPAEFFVEVRVVVAPQGKWVRFVDDALVGRLRGLKHLNYLDLRDTSVTDQGLEHVGQLRSLSKLLLRGTLISSEGKARLRKSLPNCSLDDGK